MDTSKEDTWMKIFGWSLLVFIICTILIFVGVFNIPLMIIYLVDLVIGITSIIAYNSKQNQRQNEQKELYSQIDRQVDDIAENYKVELKIKYESLLSKLHFSGSNREKLQKKIWTADNKLYIINSLDKIYSDFKSDINTYVGQSKLDYINKNIKNNRINYCSIPLHDIKYFAKDGDISYETLITGGGGCGSSIKGAVIGGVIAGGAGAVIGSRQTINGIKSETVTHDTRKTILKYYENNSLQSLEYPTEFFDIFEELIPDKEYNIVVAKESSNVNTINNIHSTNNVKDKLRQLNDLKAEGLITEKEYTTKKQELLSEL